MKPQSARLRPGWQARAAPRRPAPRRLAVRSRPVDSAAGLALNCGRGYL